jgi:predicted transcriptional regulator
MEEVWRLGSATVREVMEAINRGSGHERAYTTFLTVLMRLEDKGLLRRRREGRSDVYSAVMDRDEYMRTRAQVEVDALVDELGDVALAHFARQIAELDPARRAQLRRLARRR